ncbi:hypothetical protein SAMN05216410_2721 [Sanguibacter gelidistatuariae]|uniref:Uncharacterized protein n=1 Tax=Sanguibacter gelidistatuariae TaxID=1814289 RepID=A0A1G6RNN5_9MICO|nr:hypothetical protein [Sanguibacter gelidistatuariae]SDD05546.1 hypothetical protein SAMN05216410_2721 [Sanguibacter gelidistatuariae]
MTDTILVLTEDTLLSADAEKIVALHRDDDVRYRVLVPADTDRSLLGAIFEHLGSGQFKEAWEDATEGKPSTNEAKAEAGDQLAGSITALAAAGASASGQIIDEDPLPALHTAIAAEDILEVVVVSYPHLVEDTFHRDWASRARDELHVPVLHLYSGTSELG